MVKHLPTMWETRVQSLGQEDLLEWIAFPPPGDLLDPEIKLASPALVGEFFTDELSITIPLLAL